MKRAAIYVTGLSCRFPESDSSNEFFQNLLNKRDMVTADDRRWKEKVEGLPERIGKIKQSLNLFDNKFFAVHGKQAERMDPQLRILLEVSYEALVDAGNSLEELRGTNTGVYIGACGSDVQKAWFQNRDAITGYEHVGSVPSMLANRLSFYYDLHGPSEAIDTACSSSLVALHRAVTDLETGVCDTAIVGGTSIILLNAVNCCFNKLKMLSPDGACKSFDKAANGFARAEGIAIIVLTTKKNNRYKPYAQILGTGVNNGGWNPTGITFPSGEQQKELYKAVCAKAGIEPKEIDYVEAHGTGTVVGDGEELGAIYEVYGKENPQLIIGSVKSNMGHCEGAAGLAGIIKTMLCFDQETLAPNLHLHDPNEKLKGMRVMTEPFPSWEVSKAGISSFGFGGTNAHAIIEKCNDLEEKIKGEVSPIHLTFLASRTKEGLAQLKKVCPPGMEIPNRENKQKLPFRDVLELPDDTEVLNVSDTQEMIYIACSGNGSQWKGMGLKYYATFPLFKKAIDRCGKAVDKNISAILKDGFKDALDATLSLVAMQIGLIELLKSFGIKEEQIGGFFGHSAGEIVCSYLDKITTLEETMRIAYARGFVATQTEEGLMASIGLSHEKANELIEKNQCGDRVCVACINSATNVTISGYKESVLALVNEVNEKEIFNRVLDTYGRAYHSPLMKARQSELETLLAKKMDGLKAKRTSKWSTSILNHQADVFDHKYHVEAVLKPVDFIQALKGVPQNGLVLEIGPHSVLRSLIKENRPDIKYAAFMKKETDELETLKEGLGKLWKYGLNFTLNQKQIINGKRPSLEVREKLVAWDHSEEFVIPDEKEFYGSGMAEFKVVYDLTQDKDRYLSEHVIGDKALLPATSYLCAMWDAFRKAKSYPITDSITYSFTDFEILQAVQVEADSKIEMVVNHLEDQYELIFKDTLVARAKIDVLPNKVWEPINADFKESDRYIDHDNFYRIIGTLGYQYQGGFRVIDKMKFDFENNRNFLQLKGSRDNWITLLDGVLQSLLIAPKRLSDELRVPVRIRSIAINPQVFCMETSGTVPAIADFDIGSVNLPGIEVVSMETKVLARKNQADSSKLIVKHASDILYFGENLEGDSFLLKCLSVIRDTASTSHDLNILEIGTGTGEFTRAIGPYLVDDKYIATDITEASQIAPDARTDHLNLSYEKFDLNNYDSYSILNRHNVDVVVAANALHNDVDKILESLYSNLKEGGFLIFSQSNALLNPLKQVGFAVISYTSTFLLARKPQALKLKVMDAPEIDQFDKWYPKIRDCTEPTLLVAKNLSQSGALGFARCLNKELASNTYYCLFTDQEVTDQHIAQIEKYGLKGNVFRDNRWGVICDIDIRYRPVDKKSGFFVRFPTVGDFGNYEWLTNTIPNEGIKCTTKFAALNFRDVMLVTGKVTKDAFSGFFKTERVGGEFSGCDAAGNRYMGLCEGLATQVSAQPSNVLRIPPNLSYEDAATIPVVYATVYYALFNRANIQRGQSILIHAGTGGVGQAALRVCISLGCKIFVTCHQSKRPILKSLFPELEDSSILDSRTTEFEKQIMKQTGGKGVDIVLNSLAGDKLHASIRVLSLDGHFLEIGKYDMINHTGIDMNIMLKNITFHGIVLDQLLAYPDKTTALFNRMEQDTMKGIVKPLPRHVFHHTQIDEAFRFLASGKHIGKVLIDMENIEQKASPGRFKVSFQENTKENGYYLVTGGLGGFGLALVQWFFNRGVRKFLVTSRKGISTPEQARMINVLRQEGAEIIVSTKDVTVAKEAEELIQSVQGNIRAVFHLAMVLEDGLFKSMTKEKWEGAVHIKAKGAQHLDQLTRLPSVKHFVVFSSIASRIGNIGQTNYAFGNAVMEEICRLRAKDGHHALAIQWGVIDNVGFVANHAALHKSLKALFDTITIDEALQFVDDILSNELNSHCVQCFTDRLKVSKSEQTKFTFEEVIERIGKVIKMDLMKCNANETLEYLGVDSLQVVEIQTILIKVLQEVLPLKKISAMRIGELKQLVEVRLGGGKKQFENTDTSADENLPLLTPFNKTTGDEIVYLFLGYGVKDQSLKLKKTDRFNITVVAWQNTTTIDAIIHAIESDVKKNNYKKIRFLSHSAGYHIAKVVISQTQLPIEKFAAISLVDEGVFRKLLSIKDIENVSDAIFEHGYKDFGFYIQDHLPISKIRKQAMLLSKVLDKKYLPPHLVMNPRSDTLCDRTKGGIEISGTHHVDSFDLEEIYAQL